MRQESPPAVSEKAEYLDTIQQLPLCWVNKTFKTIFWMVSVVFELSLWGWANIFPSRSRVDSAIALRKWAENSAEEMCEVFESPGRLREKDKNVFKANILV